MKNFLFTSESVSEGHPDKICDKISDTLLDAYLAKDRRAKVAIEVMVTSKTVILAGEVRSVASIEQNDIEKITRKVIKDIGYEQNDFHWQNVTIHNYIHGQSSDIAKGVDATQGAGDQGIMFGYACNETEMLMPASIYYCHRVLERINQARHAGELPEIKPDAKIQLTLQYQDDKPVGIETILLSTQHSRALRCDDIMMLLRPYIEDILPWSLRDAKLYINPAGNFIEGGPHADTGLTGRKIVVDAYGGSAPSGGGCFSGKDATKVDRSAAYAARYLAKNLVAAKLMDRCTLQLSYGIGISEHLSIFINGHGTEKHDIKIIKDIALKLMDLRVSSISEKLQLHKPIYAPTSAYGHFGRLPSAAGHFSWEKLDLQQKIKDLL